VLAEPVSSKTAPSWKRGGPNAVSPILPAWAVRLDYFS
jgi:hypothetical protein